MNGTMSAQVPDSSVDRRSLVEAGVCQEQHPAVTVELYGSLRLKAGRELVPMRADTIATAIMVLRRAHPPLSKLLPEGDALTENFRFSVNGRAITTDLSAPLHEGDRLILFSASVGG
jgi:hypothetical protein